ncbi:MAG TPA: hypothetical protein DCE52_00710 [Rhodobacteraceae bacterium]|nr:hypothetical protein [Paracoccaceae bacterium]
MSLLNYLLGRSGDERLLWTGEGWKTVADACIIARQIRAAHTDLEGARVLLCPQNDVEMIFGLLAFDGFVDQMLLIAGNTTDDEIKQMRERCTVDRVVDLSFSEFVDLTIEADGEIDEVRNTKWIVPTSGTTGTPKLVAHTLDSLAFTVRRNQTVGSDLVWGMIYDVTRFAGIQVLLQAVIGSSGLAVVNDRQDVSTAALQFSKAGVNALSATPTMWRKLVMSGVIDALDLRIITMGGEPADQKILDELIGRFPKAKVTAIYASTEAGVGFSVSDGLAGFPSDYEKGKLRGGNQLRVLDGKLLLRKVTEGGTYVGIDESITDTKGWIDTGDLVEKRGERYHFLGRASGAINVGGQKVHPTEVERIIDKVPGVSMVVVSGRRNPIMGSLVEAHVVALKGVQTDKLKEHILQACRVHLAGYKGPASIKFLDDIPTTLAGKIKRK